MRRQRLFRAPERCLFRVVGALDNGPLGRKFHCEEQKSWGGKRPTPPLRNALRKTSLSAFDNY
jgi:hypothetical protein